jgi:hypothetical protein
MGIDVSDRYNPFNLESTIVDPSYAILTAQESFYFKRRSSRIITMNCTGH